MMKPLGPADPATAGPYRLLAELGDRKSVV